MSLVSRLSLCGLRVKLLCARSLLSCNVYRTSRLDDSGCFHPNTRVAAQPASRCYNADSKASVVLAELTETFRASEIPEPELSAKYLLQQVFRSADGKRLPIDAKL